MVAGGTIAGEGYHQVAGGAHAEINALQTAGNRARGATLYVSLEPCNHQGRTGPCSHAVADAGIARVVAGVADPNPKTAAGGFAYLRERGIAVECADDPQAKDLIAPFATAIRAHRPFVTLKMAMSLDGFVASQPGRQEWLTGDAARAYVRDLRIDHDAVAVGAGTVRVDDPQLTVRPAHPRMRDYVRVVFCETQPVDPGSRVFAAHQHYAKTIVAAPGGAREAFAPLERVADLIFTGDRSSAQLDIAQALAALYDRGINSLLCEGGPTMAGHLLRLKLVDRLAWLVAPRFLRSASAVPVVAGGELNGVRGLRIAAVERLGEDLLLTGLFDHV